MTTIADKLQQLRTRIEEACRSAGRSPEHVSLLAVSKTFAGSCVIEAATAGQRAFGENYLQEAVAKMAHVQAAGQGDLQWHCIGPVQANKTRLVAEHFHWIHTLDRERIAVRLSEQRPTHLAPLQVCLQVNVDAGANKAGVAPEEVVALARSVAQLPGLRLRGVMSIPEPVEGFDAQLALHQRARSVFEAVRAAGLPGCDQFDTLSLGMTGDLEAAIAAGSTMVRVGSGLFGQRTIR